jgi:hypothetical protein
MIAVVTQIKPLICMITYGYVLEALSLGARSAGEALVIDRAGSKWNRYNIDQLSIGEIRDLALQQLPVYT